VLFPAVAGMYFVAINVITVTPDENTILGRFAMLKDVASTQEFRIIGMRIGLEKVTVNPILGFGDYHIALEECSGYLPHIGPLLLALIHGIPAGLLSCLILLCGIIGDFVKGSGSFVANPNFAGIRALSTISGWTSLALVMTNQLPESFVLYAALGIAMWPMIERGALTLPLKRLSNGERKLEMSDVGPTIGIDSHRNEVCRFQERNSCLLKRKSLV